MTEKLTIFGKEFESPSNGERKASVGFFVFRIYKWSDGYTGSANVALIPESEPFATAELCIAWLESEARRIAREMIEMAGPMVAVEMLAHDIAKMTTVRFRDE